MSDLQAIILTGGRAARLDGIPKALVRLEGATLLERAVHAARAAGAADIIIVGPAMDPAPDRVRWVREAPAFSGPAAALHAAMSTAAEDAAWTLVLAVDLIRPAEAVARLMADRELWPADTDGVCLGDASSRPQWLTGLYRTAALARGAASLDDEGRDQPVRQIMAELAIAVVRAPDDVVADIDTWQDLQDAGAVAPRAEKEDDR
ncbi:NTP transferase domain-containing protein [Microbacterium sp. BG28]|uniref:molybdenum cofactor guanylyltransferase n=1 Tax=Microbacterium sp. BG28 TaxID=3097356 RepID=UPI002A5AA8C3|nr:NTP transferase domain-containing protein [Microbacterium sp. BG28]MDY0827659.1 NTP transferase domain-containing protein [Microbacterium sp. BG28]